MPRCCRVRTHVSPGARGRGAAGGGCGREHRREGRLHAHARRGLPGARRGGQAADRPWPRPERRAQRLTLTLTLTRTRTRTLTLTARRPCTPYLPVSPHISFISPGISPHLPTPGAQRRLHAAAPRVLGWRPDPNPDPIADPDPDPTPNLNPKPHPNPNPNPNPIPNPNQVASRGTPRWCGCCLGLGLG